MTKIIHLDLSVLHVTQEGKGECFSPQHKEELVLVCLCLSHVFFMG